jgi:hypothetical protein
MSASKRFYTVHPETDPLSGECLFRVVVLHANGRIKSLPPRFRDENSLETYLTRWNPELAGKRVEYLQLIAEAQRQKINDTSDKIARVDSRARPVDRCDPSN